jgi:hypothetical protein
MGSGFIASFSQIASPVSLFQPVWTWRVRCSPLGGGFLGLLVEAGDVAHAHLRHDLVAALHLAHDPFEGEHGLLRIGDDRGEEVGDALVDREFEHLRVDHDEAALLGRQLEHEREDHRVDADRLARAGGAGDEQVGHLAEIADHRLAFDRLAECEGKGGMRERENSLALSRSRR